MNASCCRPDLDVKVRSDLTVSVTLFPLALHRPVGEDLEVMSAIHAVQPSQSPVVPQLQRAAVPHAQIHHRVSIRHPARQETSLSTAGGVCDERGSVSCGNSHWICPLAEIRCLCGRERARDHTGSHMRSPDSWQHPTGVKITMPTLNSK